MSKRTEDLAAQARDRAAAEQRAGQSIGGNSDAAELYSRRDLRADADLRNADLQQPDLNGSDLNEPSRTVITHDANRPNEVGQIGEEPSLGNRLASETNSFAGGTPPNTVSADVPEKQG